LYSKYNPLTINLLSKNNLQYKEKESTYFVKIDLILAEIIVFFAKNDTTFYQKR
jgi:hypothetical protein